MTQAHNHAHTNITINNKEYVLEHLPNDVQELVKMYFKWSLELETQRVELIKTESAMRAINAEISARIVQAEKIAAAAAPAKEVAPEADKKAD